MMKTKDNEIMKPLKWPNFKDWMTNFFDVKIVKSQNKLKF
jgi:hypothetical protein